MYNYNNQVESDAEFDRRYEAYFNRADIDGWEIRKVRILSIRNGSKKIYLGVFLGRFETLNHWPDIYDHKKYR